VSAHELWHVFVLASTLLAAAGAAILVLASVIFDAQPPGLERARPAVMALIAAGVVIVLVEWFVVH
jgi:hypothetical protein